MNYIELINNFWKADTEHSFTGNETKLYMYLLHTSNSLGWKNPFRLSYRQIELGSGLSVNTVKTTRNRLKQAGMIDFTEGRKGNPRDFGNKTVYAIRLSEFDSHSGNHSGNQSGSQSGNQTEDINKLETINLNINNIPPLVPPREKSSAEEGEDFDFIPYPPEKKKEKSCAKKERKIKPSQTETK